MTTAEINTQESFITLYNCMAATAHRNARSKGFWETSDKLQSLAEANGLGLEMRKMRDSQLRELMHSELGEACEGDRKDLPADKIPGFTNVEEELADLLIRLMDYSYGRGLRVAEAVIAKMEYNSGRPYKHGDKHF